MGMESFDLGKFDYTSPASWEALGKLWQVTNGYLPSTEQLMQFVMTSASGLSEMTPATSNKEFTTPSIPNGMATGGKARGGFPGAPGRGGHGNGRSGVAYYDATDAVLLGGGLGEGQSAEPKGTSSFSAQSESALASSSGRMQKVGDKWVFVRGIAMDVS
jgi:protein NRD1